MVSLILLSALLCIMPSQNSRFVSCFVCSSIPYWVNVNFTWRSDVTNMLCLIRSDGFVKLTSLCILRKTISLFNRQCMPTPLHTGTIVAVAYCGYTKYDVPEGGGATSHCSNRVLWGEIRKCWFGNQIAFCAKACLLKIAPIALCTVPVVIFGSCRAAWKPHFQFISLTSTSLTQSFNAIYAIYEYYI